MSSSHRRKGSEFDGLQAYAMYISCQYVPFSYLIDIIVILQEPVTL